MGWRVCGRWEGLGCNGFSGTFEEVCGGGKRLSEEGFVIGATIFHACKLLVGVCFFFVINFLCLFSQECFKEKNKSSIGLDVYTDIALASSYFIYNLLNMMYCGPLPTQVEIRCSHLLKSKLLQR